MSEKAEPTPMSTWGRDHWSVLAYIGTRCVDHRGVPDRRHMRTDPTLHPFLADPMAYAQGVLDTDKKPGHARARAALRKLKKYPTQLKDGIEKANHDDWNCVEDMEAVGLLTWEGTGINPVFVLTALGKEVEAALRVHKMGGGNFAKFVPSPELQARIAAKVEAMAQEQAEAEAAEATT